MRDRPPLQYLIRGGTSKVSTGASKRLYQARPRTVAFSERVPNAGQAPLAVSDPRRVRKAHTLFVSLSSRLKGLLGPLSRVMTKKKQKKKIGRRLETSACAAPQGNGTAGHFFFGKRNGSRTCLVQTFGRAGTNLGRDGTALPHPGWMSVLKLTAVF